MMRRAVLVGCALLMLGDATCGQRPSELSLDRSYVHFVPQKAKIHSTNQMDFRMGTVGYRTPRTDPIRRAFYGCAWSTELHLWPRGLPSQPRALPHWIPDGWQAWIPQRDYTDYYLDDEDCEGDSVQRDAERQHILTSKLQPNRRIPL